MAKLPASTCALAEFLVRLVLLRKRAVGMNAGDAGPMACIYTRVARVASRLVASSVAGVAGRLITLRLTGVARRARRLPALGLARLTGVCAGRLVALSLAGLARARAGLLVAPGLACGACRLVAPGLAGVAGETGGLSPAGIAGAVAGAAPRSVRENMWQRASEVRSPRPRAPGVPSLTSRSNSSIGWAVVAQT